MFDKKYCVKCGNPISNDSVYCFRCGTKQDICENKFCKQCGKKIDLHAEFCPTCGTKQNHIKDKVVSAFSSLSSSVKGIFNVKRDEPIEIPHGYYRCPSCGKLHLLESSECIKNEDNDFFIGASWYVGSYYITTSKEFYSYICPSCYKFKKINKYIKIAVALICFILAAIIYVSIEGFSWKILIIPVFFGSIAAYIFSWMVSFIYKVFIYLFLRKNLFYRFEKAKKYGALYSCISVEDIRRIMQK